MNNEKGFIFWQGLVIGVVAMALMVLAFEIRIAIFGMPELSPYLLAEGPDPVAVLIWLLMVGILSCFYLLWRLIRKRSKPNPPKARDC